MLAEYVAARYDGARIPYELEYHLVRTRQDEQENKVSLEGGDITDKDGQSIWASKCYLTGCTIQNGEFGAGMPRHHSLSRKDGDRTVGVHHLQLTIEKAIKAAGGDCETEVTRILERR